MSDNIITEIEIFFVLQRGCHNAISSYLTAQTAGGAVAADMYASQLNPESANLALIFTAFTWSDIE
jgi:hypothetical protein